MTTKKATNTGVKTIISETNLAKGLTDVLEFKSDNQYRHKKVPINKIDYLSIINPRMPLLRVNNIDEYLDANLKNQSTIRSIIRDGIDTNETLTLWDKEAVEIIRDTMYGLCKGNSCFSKIYNDYFEKSLRTSKKSYYLIDGNTRTATIIGINTLLNSEYANCIDTNVFDKKLIVSYKKAIIKCKIIDAEYLKRNMTSENQFLLTVLKCLSTQYLDNKSTWSQNAKFQFECILTATTMHVMKKLHPQANMNDLFDYTIACNDEILKLNRQYTHMLLLNCCSFGLLDNSNEQLNIDDINYSNRINCQFTKTRFGYSLVKEIISSNLENTNIQKILKLCACTLKDIQIKPIESLNYTAKKAGLSKKSLGITDRGSTRTSCINDYLKSDTHFLKYISVKENLKNGSIEGLKQLADEIIEHTVISMKENANSAITANELISNLKMYSSVYALTSEQVKEIALIIKSFNRPNKEIVKTIGLL